MSNFTKPKIPYILDILILQIGLLQFSPLLDFWLLSKTDFPTPPRLDGQSI